VIMFPRSPSFPFCEVNYLAHSNPAFVSFISQNENDTGDFDNVQKEFAKRHD
jgi:hypothetical protein